MCRFPHIRGYVSSKIECEKCGASTADGFGVSELAARWNRRPPAHMYTLEELWEMDGKCVWCEIPYFDKGLEKYVLVNVDRGCFIDNEGNTYSLDDCGGCVAYDRPPEEE